jgi:predicted nucleic acid-binding protein
MGTYFLDSSALVKRHIDETGSTWIRALCDQSSGNTIAIGEIARVEVIASFCRRARENPPRLQIADRDYLIQRFQDFMRREYVIIRPTRSVLNRAALLCQSYPLRAYDAVQLALALAYQRAETEAESSEFTFVCADVTLLAAAAVSGLAIENPNDHP